MTPEQETLIDNMVFTMRQAERFARHLERCADYMPLAISDAPPSDTLELNILAFVKRFEMIQDQISRKLFRSVLIVRGVTLRSHALAEVMGHMTELGVVDDPALWEHITRLRNTFAHDYMLDFNELVPIVNEAWKLAPKLIEMVDRVETYVVRYDLLVPVEELP